MKSLDFFRTVGLLLSPLLLSACIGEAPLEDEDVSGVAAAALTVQNAHNITIRFSKLALGVASGSLSNGADVVQWTPSYNVNDRLWYVQTNSDGTLTFKNKNSGKCLDVNGASQADGAAVIQWTCKGTANQKWIATPVSDGFYTLKAVHSNKCLDLTGPSSTLGTKLQQYSCWNGENQQFKLPSEAARQRFVGNITTNGAVESTFLQYWDQITPENEGKWGSVEATRDVMSWKALDAAHQFAVDHGIPFKQHNFVWGAQQPSWIAGLSQAEQKAEVEEWISSFCARYPDVALIDVVNEPPPHTTPPYAAALGGAGSTGYDWIITAFQMARHYCPNATLILNDYNVLSYDTQNFVKIVNAVKGSGYIDALGEQAHGLESIPYATLQANLNTVLATGLPLYITEYDINKADDAAQKAIMQQQFTLFWSTPQIHGMTLWGYVYGTTWKPYTGLVKNGASRPALDWLMTFIGK